MFRKFGLLVFTAVLYSLGGFSQNFTIDFVLVDDAQQPLRNASMVVGNQKLKADSLGFAQVKLPKGKVLVQVTAVNHYPFNETFSILSDTVLVCSTRQRYSLLNSVVIRSNKNVSKNQMSAQIINIETLKKLPVLLGEVDPLKTITLLPGIKSGGEASAGIYVRGGGPDQNLILLDGVNIYNPNHLLGFFSVFNGDAIKSIEVLKGGFPAEYGGRLSSVINITSRDGDVNQFKGSASIGLISSKLSLEAPIQKGKSSFIVSARRTYIDQVAGLVAKSQINGNGYYFYDINARATYVLNKKNKLSFTFFNGKDDFTFSNNDGIERNFNTLWGSTVGALNWEQKINKKLQQQTSLIYNKFSLDSKFGFSSLSFLFTSGLRDIQAKSDWQLKQYDWLNLKWGVNYTNHTFRPGAGGVTAGVQQFKLELKNKYAREAAAYASADVDITPELNAIVGMRFSHFNQIGPTEQTVYDNDGFPTGEVLKFNRGQSIALYNNWEPRIALRYKLNETQSLKFAYSNTAQYVQLATTSGATFPSDLWVPASQRIKPGRANQIALGYFKNFKQNIYEFSAEAYYKTLTNQIEFKPGANLLLNGNLENEMIFGKGQAYGLELFFQKKEGRFTGWVGYTISRSNRTFAELNEGKVFPYRYDRTHDLSVVGNYKINKKWDFSAVFVYGTGNALTLPVGRFTYNLGYNGADNQPIFTNVDLYGKVNDYRMPAYHRLDINFSYTRKPDSKKRFKSNWNFGLYNVYNRYNPYFIYLNVDEDSQKIQGKKVFLFPIIPSVNWNIKF
jgi:TonB dependent receptor/TonB-dependent Receptor Plug Domain